MVGDTLLPSQQGNLFVAEDEAANFASGGFGKFGQELDPARVFVGMQAIFDEGFEVLGQGLGWFVLRFEDDVGSGLDKSVLVGCGDDGGFEDGGMSDEGRFDFEG